MKNLLLIITSGIFFVSCATPWRPLVHAEIISMTRSEIKQGTYKSLGPVSASYCFDRSTLENTLTYDASEATIGLVDEAVMRAQKRKRADAIMDAQIQYKGRCVRIRGTAIAVRR